jgi:hypothetical protein
VTDYLQFERLCHDLMVLEGYGRLEPLGGFKDKGRDAIHVSEFGGTSIFAYSVREDWKVKLDDDSRKIAEHSHKCDQLVFVTTAKFTAGERDASVNTIQNKFGWRLEIYGLERLRILLDTKYPWVKAQHPQIFPPNLRGTSPSEEESSSKRVHLFINYSIEDQVLADWLSHRLTAEGYLVWHDRLMLLGGEHRDRDTDNAIQNLSFAMIALYSQASLRNPNVMHQRSMAHQIGGQRKGDFLIPLQVDDLDQGQLDYATAQLTFVPFDESWAHGLTQLLAKLDSVGCPRPLEHGRQIVAAAIAANDLIRNEPETLVSNCLRIRHIPEFINEYIADRPIAGDRLEALQTRWSFREIKSQAFLSLYRPPDSFQQEFGIRRASRYPWARQTLVKSIRTVHLVTELLHKALRVKCYEEGLRHCPATGVDYFPEGVPNKNRLVFKLPNGSRSNVNTSGARKFWRVSGSDLYKYQLAPCFTVRRQGERGFVVIVRVRVRFTDLNGQVLPPRTAVSRRKHLCKNWWNDQWLKRVLAVCQFLAKDDTIILGHPSSEHVAIDAMPMKILVPVSLDESALGKLDRERPDWLLGTDDDEYELAIPQTGTIDV